MQENQNSIPGQVLLSSSCAKCEMSGVEYDPYVVCVPVVQKTLRRGAAEYIDAVLD